jgi:hypothetical protein
MEAFQVANHSHLDLARMRTAIVMVAVERYRRAHQRWPEALTDLVPVYLKTVPTDPYDGATVRIHRLSEGVVVYSVGEDSQDDGGNVESSRMAVVRDSILSGKPGTDRGWRLWDAEHRRQLPGK